ncbi:MAG: hypothetical protein KJZ70_10205 [Bryobacterales bacterium]|nr:hypothetical protein [Bryobacterales bacterium]
MIIASSVAVVVCSIAFVVVVLLYVLLIRHSDLPYVEPVSPVAHLDERKAAIFENIRDSNFEFLMGKLSAEDYQQTKNDLQKELASVNAEIESVLATLSPSDTGQSDARRKATTKTEPVALAAAANGNSAVVCPHCNATFARPMRFCGECGKPLEGEAQ